MKTTTLELPTLYGDHHVLEVRKILLATPGVEEVYASSAFNYVEVSFDPTITNDIEIQMKLDEAGYLGEWSLPTEVGTSVYQRPDLQSYFRHTEVFETARNVVSFGQVTENTGRPLWPCPGMGIIKQQKVEE